jgi:hypothetical protein
MTHLISSCDTEYSSSIEDRVLRKIFGPNWADVTGDWRRLHSEELHDLYSSNIIQVIKPRRMRLVGHLERMWERRRMYRVLVGKPERKRLVGRPRRRREDSSEMDLQEIGCEDVDLTDLAHDRDKWRAVVNTVMNLQVP